MPKRRMVIQIPPEIYADVLVYATEHGQSVSAAAVHLIAVALRRTKQEEVPE